jgi:DNA-binding GntR family transcriptional regulator
LSDIISNQGLYATRKELNSSSTLRAYEHLKELMFGHKIVPGQKLIYRDLEEIVGMSKTPIINALSKLEEEGLVTAERNRGYYVKQLTEKEIEELYDLRTRLEEISVEYAIRNGQDKDLRAVRKALEDYEKYERDIYDLRRFRLDAAFHLEIAKMGKNAFLVSVLKRLFDNSYILVDVAGLTPLISQYKKEHLLLYDAIAVKDLKEAKKIIVKHEKSCGKMIRASLAQAEGLGSL